jgi:hypothetical protein
MYRKIAAIILLLAVSLFTLGGSVRPLKRWQFQGCCGNGTQVEVQTKQFYMDGANLVEGFVEHEDSPFSPDGIYIHRGWNTNPKNAQRWRARCCPSEGCTGDGWYSFKQFPDVCPPQNGE